MENKKEDIEENKMDRYSDEWEKLANETARRYVPSIHPCKDCGKPVIRGYCCEYCGSVEPR